MSNTPQNKKNTTPNLFKKQFQTLLKVTQQTPSASHHLDKSIDWRLFGYITSLFTQQLKVSD